MVDRSDELSKPVVGLQHRSQAASQLPWAELSTSVDLSGIITLNNITELTSDHYSPAQTTYSESPGLGIPG